MDANLELVFRNGMDREGIVEVSRSQRIDCENHFLEGLVDFAGAQGWLFGRLTFFVVEVVEFVFIQEAIALAFNSLGLPDDLEEMAETLALIPLIKRHKRIDLLKFVEDLVSDFSCFLLHVQNHIFVNILFQYVLALLVGVHFQLGQPHVDGIHVQVEILQDYPDVSTLVVTSSLLEVLLHHEI